MIAQINCSIDPCNAGAKAGIDFIHSLPEPVQLGLYLVFGLVFITALVVLASRPFR